MKKLILIALFALPLLTNAEEAAKTEETAKTLDGAVLYKTKTCLTCHGKDAKTPLLPVYPKIAGQNKEYIIQQMNDIKSGARSNGMSAAMKGVMHLVNDEEIAVLAEWLSVQEP